MSNYIVLYNPLAGNKTSENQTKKLKDIFFGENVELLNMTEIDNYKTFFDSISTDDKIVISGGDGTLNKFINDTYNILPENEILYYPTGSGNDFMHDVEKTRNDKPFVINQYLKNLPVVSIGGNTYRFTNGIGFGLDGFCCSQGDILREKTTKPINYTKIAILALLYKFKPVNAKIVVDGKTLHYKNVWLAATMKGRFYGGGLMAAPHQNRLSDNLSVFVVTSKNRFKLLCLFPSILKGTQGRFKKEVSFITGKHIVVEFDRPTPAQVDGETLNKITKYEVFSKQLQHHV